MAKGERHAKVYGRSGREKTRSKKPTLIEDPELEEKVLNAQLREANLYAANILGDGNCLFRALSDQLYGSPSMHLALRHEVCDYLSANPDKYRFFIDEDSVKGGFNGHVREMRQPGTYGTNIELSAFVARYRRPVKVYQPNLVYVLPVDEADSSASGGAAEGSRSPSPLPPGPELEPDEPKLSARERRMKAREEKAAAKGEKVKGKGKGKEVVQAKWTAPDPQPFDGTPLCIVYHSWEHYSSLRNLDGPHTGPPRLRVARLGSPALTEQPHAADNEQTAKEDDLEEVEPDDDQPASPYPSQRDVDMAEADDDDAEVPVLRLDPDTDALHTGPAIRLASSRPHKATDGQSLPSVRAALARVKADATSAQPSRAASPSLHPPETISHGRLPPLPPPPALPTRTNYVAPAAAERASPRPPKHTLDRSRPRSPSQATSSSSSSGATSPLHPDEQDPDPDPEPDLDENDNDSLSRRLRSRVDSPALSTSTASTGVASASSGYSGGSGDSGGTQASSPPDPKAAAETSPASDGAFEEGEDVEGEEATPSPASAAAASTSKTRSQTRQRRGPTAAEKKELARQRRVERRRAKAVGAQAGTRASADEGRVLRSGRTTGKVGPAGGEGELGKMRELFI
ncbi:hypothetical protein JCM11641_007146 [Rhodosporidiobolus odoratus]